MSKRLLLGWLVVYIVQSLSSFLIHHVILGSTYAAMGQLWRPDMQSKLWMLAIVGVCSSFFFTIIFARWRRKPGMLEGGKFGFYIGFWMSFAMAISTYATAPIPFSLAVQWFVYGTIAYAIAGMVLGTILKETEQKQTVGYGL